MTISFATILHAVYVGLITGYLVALPTGPAGLESIRWTLTKGLKQGIFVAFGAVVADALDVVLINYGFLELLKIHIMIEVSFWLLFGGLVLFIGLRDMKRQKMHMTISPVKPKKTKPHQAFLTGFLFTITYPGVHLFWITFSSTIIRTWKASSATEGHIFTVAVLVGMFLGVVTINVLAHFGKKLTIPAFVKKIGEWVPFIIVLMGAGFIVTGVVIFIRHIMGLV